MCLKFRTSNSVQNTKLAKMKVLGGLPILLLLMLQFRINYGSMFTPEFETNLTAFINASMACRLIPGMTLTVVKGKIL